MKNAEQQENITFEYRSETNGLRLVRTNFCCQLFFLYLAVYGSIYSFLSAFEIQENSALYYLLFLPACIVVLLVFYSDTQRRLTHSFCKKLRLTLLAVTGIIGILGYPILRVSFWGLVGQMDTSNQQEAESGTLFVLYCSVLLTIFYAYLIYHNKKLIANITMILSIAIPVVFGYLPNSLPLVVVFMFLLGQSIMEHQKQGEYVNHSSQTAVVIALLMFILYLLIHFLYHDFYFERHLPFRGLSNQITTFWENRWKGSDQEIAAGGVNQGELGTVDQVTYQDLSMLTLTSGYIGTIYLRGYIGSRYAENRWNELDEVTQQQSKNMFATFQDQEFDVYNMQNELFGILDSDADLMEAYLGKEEYEDAVFKRTFHVIYQNAASDLWYLPYNSGLILQDVFTQEYPTGNTSDVITSLNYHSNQMDYDKLREFVEQYQGDNEELLLYRDLELQYRQYAYQAYTMVDEAQQKAIDRIEGELEPYLESFILSGNDQTDSSALTDQTTANKLALVYALTEYFQENYTYTLAPGKVPDGKDFVTYFLDESKQGYCTYYATAATLILRKYGIPARYVEGYKVNVNPDTCLESKLVSGLRKSKVINREDNYKEYTVDVKDCDAHAWVEIYADGIGWIPVDVTPSAENVLGMGDGISEETNHASDEDTDTASNNTTIEDADSVNVTNESEDNGIYAETEAATVDSDELLDSDLDSLSRYRNQLMREYHNLAEYLFQNKTGAVDFIVAGRLLKQDIMWLLKTLFRLCLMLCIIALLVYLPTRIREQKRSGMLVFHTGRARDEYCRQLIWIYQYLEKLGVYYKVNREPTTSYSEWAIKLAGSRPCFHDNQIQQVMTVILKSTFAKEPVSEEEIRTAIEHVILIQKDSYASLNWLDRIKYRFIYNLK